MFDTKTSGKIIIGIFFLSVFMLCYLIITSSRDSKSKDISITGDFKNMFMNKPGNYPGNSIAVLNIFSPISYVDEDNYFGFRRSGAIYWVDLLESIKDNPNVKAVIIRINSPGGTVAATQEVYNEIKRVRESGKKIVVSMGDLAASGAYYIACGADYIVANPGTLLGSIGVIISGLDLTGLFKKIGVEYNVIKSGKNKDILASYRKMTSEEESLLQDVVMDVYQQFFKAVSTGRKIDSEDLKPLADGRIFSGRQALKEKLIDELGDFDRTVEITAKLAGITGKPNVVELKPDTGNMFRYLTSSFADALLGKKELKLIETPWDKLKANSSPVLYLYEY